MNDLLQNKKWSAKAGFSIIASVFPSQFAVPLIYANTSIIRQFAIR